MAISMNPQTLSTVQAFLKQAGMAIDPSSSRGVKVSVEEAEGLKKAFDAIPDPAAKKVVGQALLQLIQNDVFEVSNKTAQDVLAKVIGKPSAEVFTARDKAELVGGASIKSVAAMALGLLAKVPNLDKAQIEKLTKGLEGLPKEVKNLAYAVMNNASKEGEVKMAPDARPAFTRGYAKAEAESGGAVSKMGESFKEETSGPMEYFASVMANSPYFEDRLAALMFMVCAKGMKEVDDSLRALDDSTKADDKKRAQKPKQNGAATTGPSGASGATTSAPTGQTGQVQKGETPASTATSQLRGSYESLVQSAAAHRADDGVITRPEAESLVKKLDGLSPPEAKMLQAEAMGRALLAGGGGDLTPEMQPLADWVEKTTGKPLKDVGDAKALYEAKTPLAQTIGGSDKLENKVAAFILEGIFGEGKAPKMQAVMNEMKPLFSAMEKEVTGKTAADARAEAPKVSQHSQNIEDRFSRIATAVMTGKIPVADLTKTAASLVDRLPIAGDKKAIFDGISAGLNALAGNKTLDVKSVFAKAVGPLVETVKKDAPEVDAVVGGAVDKLKNMIAGDIFNANDVNKPMDKAAVQARLNQEAPKAKQALLDEAKANGFDAPALQALATTFDHETKALHEEVQKTGKLVSTEPRGQGTDELDPTATDQSRSRQVMFEKVKLQMNRLSEMMQAMSNILNTLHQTAENAIRAIR